MASLNKVLLIGNVGKDPEIKLINSNTIANFSIATSSSWKDKNTGEKKEETEWHSIVIYGKLAEIVGQYVKAGDKLYVEGKLKTRKWADKYGVEKYKTEVIVDQMNMLGSKKEAATESTGRQGTSGQVTKPADFKEAGRFANNQVPDDDIPF
jgi:single-strand DNA-binding protein